MSMLTMFWDMISLSIIAVLSVPVFLFVMSKDPAYLVIIIALIVCHFFVKATRYIKYPKIFNSIVMRPNKAMNCNIFNQGGVYKGRIGMPSGHVMLTIFTLTAIFIHKYGLPNKWNTQKHLHVWIILIISGIIMSMSRLYRNCHNIYQVIIGALLGVGAACCLSFVPGFLPRAHVTSEKNI